MNDNVKKHYNKKLDMILSRYITPKRYGDFSSVVKEVFQRRAYEYEFTELEMLAQVANFVENVKKIEFVPEELMDGDEGAYVPNEEAIYLNQDYLIELEKNGMSSEEIGEEILETLTHEVYHGIADRGEDVGLSHYDYTTHTYSGNALDEIFTEVSADRTSKSRSYKEAEMYRAETTGYSDITFVVNLLAASLGTTEKELLKEGIQDREHLMKLFASRFKGVDNAKFAEFQMFNKLEASLDVVYNCMYNNEEVDEATNSQILSTALTSLYGSAYDMAIFQIRNSPQEITRETVSAVAYRFSKMEKIMQDSLNDFKNKDFINDEQIQYVNYMTSILRGTMAEQVLELQGIDCMQIDRETAIRKVIAETQDMLYYNYIMQEDFDNGKKWDNEAPAQVLFSLYDKAVPYHKVEKAELGDTEPLPVVTDNMQFVDTDVTPIVTNDMQFVDTDVTPVITDDMQYVETDTMPIVTGDMELEKKGIFSKIRESVTTFFTRLKNSRTAKLNPPREERDFDNSQYYADLATAFSKKYTVRQDELRPMEDVVKESAGRTSSTRDNQRI